MKEHKVTERIKGVSRRKVIRGAAAVALVAAAGPISTRAALAAGDDKAATELPDTKSYHALALLMVFATRSKLFDPSVYSDDVIARRLGISDPNKVIVNGFRQVANSAAWRQVRNDFAKLALGPAYGGPQCPLTFETIVSVAKLYG